MPDNFQPAIAFTLHEEGGFSNDSLDPGGITNLGVTIAVWRDWVGHTVTAADMHALTVAVVTPLYRARYWQALNGDALAAIAPGVALCAFDFGVNSGDSRAARVLQSLVGASADGHLGNGTLGSITSFLHSNGQAELVRRYVKARLDFLKTLPGWLHFGGGWAARCSRVETAALKLC